MSCITGFLVLFIVILVLMLVGQGCYYKERIVQKFTDLKPMYGEFRSTLEDLKKNHKIGEAPGVLRFSDDPNMPCDTNKNQLIQSNVAFRQSKTKNGCTYIDKVWPNSS